jgi:hypothetical protein
MKPLDILIGFRGWGMHNTAQHREMRTYEGISKIFRTESITKYTLTTINTRWEATQRVMAAKFTRLTHKIGIQLHLLTESCTICSSRSRRPVRKLLDTPSYLRVSSRIPNHDPIFRAIQNHMRIRVCGHWHQLTVVFKYCFVNIFIWCLQPYRIHWLEFACVACGSWFKVTENLKRDSSVSIMTRLRTGRPEFDFQQR